MEFCGFDLSCWGNFFFNYRFGQSFFSEVFATFIGAGLGVLTAIGLRNWFERRTEKQKKEKILNLLRVELQLNLSELVKWKSRESGDLEAGTLGIKLDDEAWRAFSEGGELEWIKEPSVLFALSNAYYEIKVVQSYSEKHYDLNIIGGGRVKPASQKFINDRLKEAVVNATNTIAGTINMLKL